MRLYYRRSLTVLDRVEYSLAAVQHAAEKDPCHHADLNMRTRAVFSLVGPLIELLQFGLPRTCTRPYVT